jgi:uncharacterized protein YdeI (YjbR/CyaY-like superfamily)
VTATETHKNLPVLAFPSQAAWEAWLAAQPREHPGVWLKYAKKGSGLASVAHPEAVESALCWGWIDGLMQPYGPQHWLVRYTPRRPKSKWSAKNKAAAIRLIAEGRMQPPGLAEVERAKADGRWDAAYAPQSEAQIPDDLAAALEANPKARAFFETLRGGNRYAILYRLHDAKRPETRAKRLADFVARCARGETLR